ncbi:MAG: glycosyltransferase involved in cell wall biosynthesis [Psychroserpens sp.]|jgi:glycosyltransferase involved in cell wall biosynthesis
MNVGQKVSFVIPHKGRFEMLTKTLESISKQNYSGALIEVIIVSQTPQINSELDTKNLNFIPKIIVASESETISSLRNRGANDSSGHFLAFLDADIYLASNWINMMQKHLAKNNTIIVSAKQTCDDGAAIVEKIRTDLSNSDTDNNVKFLPGANLFLLLKSFHKIGGFPEHLITCEDYFFTDKATKFGTLYKTSDSDFIHLGEDKSYSELFKKEVWRGQSNLKAIEGRKITFRELPSIVIPVASFVCLLIALGMSLVGEYYWVFFFMACFMSPIVAYSIRFTSFSSSSLPIRAILRFYLYYFSARSIGTIAGLFKSIGANHK